MKQILVISGKGGTGKTSMTAAFADLTQNAVLADCDVDAADLHLIAHPSVIRSEPFYAGYTIKFNSSSCIRCGACEEVCRFEAIDLSRDSIIKPYKCEGCSCCVDVCPQKALELSPNLAGELFESQTRFGPMIHAKLGIAEDSSGKLVSRVRELAKESALRDKCDFILIDGPPGIGCPVIASLSGVDAAVIVTEPTVSGTHDLERVVMLAQHFSIPVYILINKYDINQKITDEIKQYCQNQKIEILGCLPFDPLFVSAMVYGKTILELKEETVGPIIQKIWQKLMYLLEN